MGELMSRILAVDPGEARIGLAVSDPTGTIARPLRVLKHTSRAQDVAQIIEAARNEGAEKIVVGLALDRDGSIGPQARRGLRIAERLRSSSTIPVETWDESGSTVAAGSSRGPSDPDDARAAAAILQDYLDVQRPA
jgi:putative Holliday junction resolvase